MAKKAAQVEVAPQEETKPKKTVIKDDTPVRVFNNTTGSVSFKNSKGVWKRMRHKGFVDVTFADVEHLYIEAPHMLTSGIAYIAWKPVRDKLGLDYENIFALKDIQEILELPEYALLDKIHNAPRSLQIEVAQYVIENISEYRVNVIRTVEKATNISIMEHTQF